jgi:cytochrome c oxidase assembly factor CtaG
VDLPGLGAAAVYGYVRLARAERPPRARRLFALGIALVAVPLNSPLETIAVHYLLVIHLLQNVMIADWAPPLLILGLTPAMRARVAARGGRPLELATRPRWRCPSGSSSGTASTCRLLRLGPPHRLAAEPRARPADPRGLVFWWPSSPNEPQRARTRDPPRLPRRRVHRLGVPLARVHLLGARVLRVLRARAALWGLSATKDQNLGGILMNASR